MMIKANYVGAPAIFYLELACRQINEAFNGFGCYLVGSCLERPDWRDIDVRFIMRDEAKKRVYEIVSKAVVQSLEEDPSQEFILAILNSGNADFYSFDRRTKFERLVDQQIEDILNELLKEVFDKEYRQKLKDALAKELEEDKIYFAGKAAITEFMDRIKQPISGDMVTFRIGIQKEEEEDECC